MISSRMRMKRHLMTFMVAIASLSMTIMLGRTRGRSGLVSCGIGDEEEEEEVKN
jgi:hypothetical protein